MSNELSGRRVAILFADGVEQVELEKPRDAVTQAGAGVTLISLKAGDVQAVNEDIHPGDTFTAELAVAEASVGDYDALLLPGGVANPDTLRTDEDAVAFVRNFAEAGKPIGVICHGPWTLLEAGVLQGRTLTSYPSVRTDLRNAGATVVDQEVVVDGNLVSSRDPDDLPAFCEAIVREFAKAPEGA